MDVRSPTTRSAKRSEAAAWGEVYRARDKKLGRDVAIKVLPEAFAQDKERLERFEREARLLATLNHPNIASIYGLEDADGVKALVLELVEGPTLADRIAEGPIPLDEAFATAGQIADALETGHEVGVIHRDLKPANVKVGRGADAGEHESGGDENTRADHVPMTMAVAVPSPRSRRSSVSVPKASAKALNRRPSQNCAMW